MRLVDIASVVGRILLGGFFLFAASNHLLDTQALSQGAAAQGVPAPTFAVIATGFLLLVGGASLVAGAWPRIGLACIVLFLVGVTPVMHAFWAMEEGPARMAQMGNFLRNIALLGAALALFAVPEPWPYGIGRTRSLGPARLGGERSRRA